MKALVQSLSKYEENVKWLNEHYNELKQKYKDEWVAVMSGKIVDKDKDLKRLIKRLQKSYGEDYDAAAVEYVTTKEIDLIL